MERVSFLSKALLLVTCICSFGQLWSQTRNIGSSPVHSRRSGDYISVLVRKAGELGKEISPQEAKQVRTLVIEGVINYDDISVIKKIADRSRCENERGKTVENYLDLDLSHAHFANTWRTDRLSVADDMFYGFSALRSVRLPIDVREIGKRAFRNCYKLVTVEMSQGVRSFGEEAFYACSHLKHITMPSQLEEIGKRCFYLCKDLTWVHLPDNLSAIGQEAFYECPLTEVQLPARLQSLGYNAFHNTKLKELYIPKSTQVMNGIPGGGIDLEYVEVEKGNRYHASKDGVLYDAGMTTLQFVPIGFNGAITVPSSVTTIGRNAFLDSGVTQIVMPESVTSVGDGAFDGCRQLLRVNLPSRLTEIRPSTFKGCSRLTDVVLPQGIVSIGKAAFSGCASLSALTLPANVSQIGEEAFKECKAMSRINLPESVTLLPKLCFRNCEALTTIQLPSRLTSIGDECFRGCLNLSSIRFPSLLKNIGDEAFRSCKQLKEVDIPASVTVMGSKPFAKCENLQRIVCRATLPPTLKGTDNKDVPLYVPASSRDAYKKAKTWKKFKSVNAM